MKRRDQLRAAVLEHAASKPRNRIERPQQRLRAELAERDDHLRLDDVDLPEEERLAGLDFVRLGIPVLGRAALDDVGDVDVLALERDGFDDLRQELPRAADERKALLIFVASRSFADEHQVGFGVADAEHDLRAPQRMELAAGAVADIGADGREALDRHQGDRHRPDLLGGRRRDRCGFNGSRPPERIAADAGDAELLGEAEMFPGLVFVHWYV